MPRRMLRIPPAPPGGAPGLGGSDSDQEQVSTWGGVLTELELASS